MLKPGIDKGLKVATPTSCITAIKAVKNDAEMAGMIEAHLRDGAAVSEFLCFLEREV